jgi:predicted esterase
MKVSDLPVAARLLLALSVVACSAEAVGPDLEQSSDGESAGSGGNGAFAGVLNRAGSGAGGMIGQGGTSRANGVSGGASLSGGVTSGGSVGFGGGKGGTGPAGRGGGSGAASVSGRGGGGTSGVPASGSGNGGGSSGAVATGGGEPVIPAVEGTCPNLTTGTISVTRGGKTLGGIQVVAGTKPSSPTAPLVFYWHGTGGVSSEFGVHASAVREGVVQEGGILVSFQGSTGGDLLSGTLIFGAGDFEIADQIVACAVANYNVDPRRIFATGCSAGGLFSGAMGVLRSSYMAAIAPNSGGLLAPGMWQSGNTPALMTIHGRPGGDVVIVDFSDTSKTADDAYKNHGGFVINCNHGGGHCGGGALAGNIWTFFKAHPYGAGKPWSALPAGFSNTCMVY